MIIHILTELLIRDLTKLKEELSSYKDEADLWKVEKQILNSGGTLTLHLIGNLKHFIGAQLGDTGYVRQREKEFSDRNIPREQMIKEIEEVVSVIKKSLSALNDEDLNKQYPIEFLGSKRTIGYMLLILSSHLGYHLGQINYHRRLI